MHFNHSDNFLWPLIDSEGRLYSERDDGYVSFSDVSQNLLNVEGQYGSRYVMGEIEG